MVQSVESSSASSADDAAPRGFASRAVHTGERTAYPVSLPANTPIYASSNFCYDDPETLNAVFGGDEPGFVYGRYGNPTVAALETVLADLEGAEAAISVSSGMGAVHLALLHELAAGDHVVATVDMYKSIHSLITDVFGTLGVKSSFLDVHDLDGIRTTLREHRSRALLVETISNPLVKVADIAALAEICRETYTTLIVDNTFATPYLVNPLALGADMVIHSTTKYLSGHGDVIGGCICADSDRVAGLTALHRLAGAVPGPFEAWLTIRGIKTLPLRVERQSRNAAELVRWLQGDPRIAAVHYPGVRDPLPAGQFVREGAGGMLGFEIAGAGQAEVFRFMSALRMIRPTSSLGDVYSLILYPAMATHRDLSPEDRAAVGISDGLIRMSAGIEDVEDLILDLDQALAAI
ncbi:MAG: aminotransferase class I/II-fold pyridoxal phosphate-dependent enzyme [Chloroflexota bacterium]|nr:aminotransferase class I/II-fold pyridoxal phosphate-dependent enzyme [Chloroflexota bacterium]